MKKIIISTILMFLVISLIGCNNDQKCDDKHVFDEGVIQEQVKVYTCKNCGFQKTENIEQSEPKFMSIEEARKEAIEILGCKPEILHIVGKFGEGYIVSIKDLDGGYSTIVDGFLIHYSGWHTLKYIINGKEMMLHTAYDYGYIVKEDLHKIEERLKGDNDEIDFPLIDPYPYLKRCIHEPGDWKKISIATCTNGGVEELYCKKCDKLLETFEFFNIPHEYQNGKCKVCGEKEYEYVDTYDETPSNMLSFYGTYRKEDKVNQGNYIETISVFGIEKETYGNKNEGYIFKFYRETLKKTDFDFIFAMSNDTEIKVQYKKEYISGLFKGKKETELVDLKTAYAKGLINKNILMDVRNRIWEENKVGNYIYEHYEEKELYRVFPKWSYLNYGEYLLNINKGWQIFKYVTKEFVQVGSISFYNKYNDYYVGEAYNILEYSDEETKIEIEGYEFVLEPNTKLIVFNEETIYDLQTAYNKGILTKENIQEIYEIYLFENKKD